MKRRGIIGLSVTILALSVIIGIAALPDEVLIESSSVDNSPTPPEEILNPTKEGQQGLIPDSVNKKDVDSTISDIDDLKKEITELKNEISQIKIDSEVSDDIPTITEKEDVSTDENSQKESEGRTITVSIKDGVGVKQR